jgi:DNA-binding XRE family transcriptional regulator
MEVFPLVTDYTANVKHDGCPYTVHISDLAIPTCRKCNERVFTPGVDDRIIAALRTQLGLLTPQDIQKRRRELGLSQQILGDQIGAAKETICRWEAGAIIQSRAMDNQLRRVFTLEEGRRLLARELAAPTPVALQGSNKDNGS